LGWNDLIPESSGNNFKKPPTVVARVISSYPVSS
jgi:hypothetical protein